MPSLSCHKLLLWGRMVVEDIEVGTDHRQRVLAFVAAQSMGHCSRHGMHWSDGSMGDSLWCASHSGSRAEESSDSELVLEQ